MCSPVGHHLQGPPLHQGKCLFSFFEKGCYIGLCVGKWGKYWATSQSCRRSFSVVINTACDGKLPPWIGTDGTQIRAGLFTVLMERLNTWRSGAFLTVCLDAQCNHLIFLVHPRFAGVISGCRVSRSASTKCIWECTAQLNRLWDPCQLQLFSLTQRFSKYPRELFPSGPPRLLWGSGRQWRDNVLKWCTPCGKWHWLGKTLNGLVSQTKIVVTLPFYKPICMDWECLVTF